MVLCKWTTGILFCLCFASRLVLYRFVSKYYFFISSVPVPDIWLLFMYSDHHWPTREHSAPLNYWHQDKNSRGKCIDCIDHILHVLHSWIWTGFTRKEKYFLLKKNYFSWHPVKSIQTPIVDTQYSEDPVQIAAVKSGHLSEDYVLFVIFTELGASQDCDWAEIENIKRKYLAHMSRDK